MLILLIYVQMHVLTLRCGFCKSRKTTLVKEDASLFRSSLPLVDEDASAFRSSPRRVEVDASAFPISPACASEDASAPCYEENTAPPAEPPPALRSFGKKWMSPCVRLFLQRSAPK